MNQITPNFLHCYRYYTEWIEAINQNVKFTKFHTVINGGGRNSGKTINAFLFALCFLFTGQPVAIFIFKNMKNEIKESIWSEIINTISEFEPDYRAKYKINQTYFTITHKKAFLRCVGLHQTTGDKIIFKGQAGLRQKHIICIYEEANTIDDKDIQSILGALRGTNVNVKWSKNIETKKNIINFFQIYNFNPDFLVNPLVARFKRNLPENAELLRTEGQQSLLVGKTLYHRTNRRVNPFYDWNSVQEDNINQLKIMNPELAKSWDLGIAGIGQQGVFTHLLKYIKYAEPNTLIKHSKEFFGGLDFGFKYDAFAFILCSLGKDDKAVGVLGEYYFENEKIGRTHEHIAMSLMQYIQQWLIKIKEYFYFNHKLIVYCDNADYAWIEICNSVVPESLKNVVIFQPVKKPQISYRIGHLLELIGREDLVLNPHNTSILQQQMTMLKWKDQENLKFEGIHDHMLDAIGYALISYLPKLQTTNMFVKY